MKTITKYLFLIVILFAFGCKNEAKKSSTDMTPAMALHTEVMEIHDEVMPLMSDIHRQKRKLLKLLDNVDGKYIIKEEIDPNILFLQEADEKMMDWMAKYDSAKKNDNSPESLKYLEAQKKEIEIVSKLMKSSIVSAKKITENVKIPNK